MKIFHLSDLHIGLKLINRDLREDQEYIFDKIAEYAKKEKPDVILIAGDIYDKSDPTVDAVDLFDSFVTKMVTAVPDAEIMMISGNHDNASRVNVFRGILQKQKVRMVGLPPRHEEEYMEQVILQDQYGSVHFYLLPFVKPSMVKMILGTGEDGKNLSYNETIRRLIQRENIDPSRRNVFVSHQFYLPVGADVEEVERMDNEIRTVGNIDEVKADILDVFDYSALGHIHKPMKVGSDVKRYCGTPIPCSVSESNQEKGIIMVELGEKGQVTTTVLPLVPLRAVKVISGTLQEVLEKACDDYVTVILSDNVEHDVLDMQDRLRKAFPYLLEIRRENIRKADYKRKNRNEKTLNEFELCCDFLSDLDEEEKALIQDVINSVKEEEE